MSIVIEAHPCRICGEPVKPVDNAAFYYPVILGFVDLDIEGSLEAWLAGLGPTYIPYHSHHLAPSDDCRGDKYGRHLSEEPPKDANSAQIRATLQHAMAVLGARFVES